MLHNPNINLSIFLTYPIPNISTIIYSNYIKKYHICIFIPKTRPKRSLKEIITPITLVIFYPKMKKKKKNKTFTLLLSKSIFFIYGSAHPTTHKPRIM